MVGHAGVGYALLIVLISFVCALLTGLSLSAIATNGPVERGGAYYLISRTLGHKLGGAVGCTYYLGITLLATLETLGAVEVLLAVEPSLAVGGEEGGVRLWSALLVAAMGAMVYAGMNFVSKMGIIFAMIVGLTLLSYYVGLIAAPFGGAPHAVTGLSVRTLRANWGPDFDPGVDFSAALSVFFPCFTGILSGANRAQALADPQRSIPRGTLGAICISLVMYLSYMVMWGAVADREYLKHGEVYAAYRDEGHGRRLLGGGAGSMQVVGAIAWPAALPVQIGIIIASISQALQCLIVAPQLLNAIATDGTVPVIAGLAKLSSKGEPHRALFVTMAVCAAACMIGSLDMVAPLLSICFLTCYAFLNLSTFMLAITRAPSWRPTWRYFSWHTAIAGFLACSVMAFLIRWYFTLVAILLVALLTAYIEMKGVTVDWGSALVGLRMQLATQSMLDLRKERTHAVNWRPQLLCLHKLHHTHMHTHEEMLAFASQLKGARGLNMVVEILEGKVEDYGAARVEAERELLEERMAEENVLGFPHVMVAPSYRVGKSMVIQGVGLGGLEPNTVLLGWPHNWRAGGHHKEDALVLVETLCECTAMEKAVLLCMHLQDFPRDPIAGGYIDIWWLIHDGGLLLLIAHLLRKSKVWRDCKLRLHTVAERSDNSDMIKRTLEELLEKLRIEASVEVVELEDDDLLAYTHDWTLRKETAEDFRQRMIAEIDGGGLATVTEGGRSGRAASMSSLAMLASRSSSNSARSPELGAPSTTSLAANSSVGSDGRLSASASISIGNAAGSTRVAGRARRSTDAIVFPQEIDMLIGAPHNSRQIRANTVTERRSTMSGDGTAKHSPQQMSAAQGSASPVPPSGLVASGGSRLSLAELTAKLAHEQGVEGGDEVESQEGNRSQKEAAAAASLLASAEDVAVDLSARTIALKPAPAPATLAIEEPSAFEQLSIESENTMGRDLAAQLKKALKETREQQQQPASRSKRAERRARRGRSRGARAPGGGADDGFEADPESSADSSVDSSDEGPSYDGDNEVTISHEHRHSLSLRLPSNRKVGDLHRKATGSAGPMHLNAKIRERSANSQLIILNLPDPDRKARERPENYMRYTEMLTKGLDRVLFVHGTGREVWTGTL